MDHLQEAKRRTWKASPQKAYSTESMLDGILHALIAIAEREENLGHETRLTREHLCLSLDKIAEQLEKANHPLCALSDITITP